MGVIKNSSHLRKECKKKIGKETRGKESVRGKQLNLRPAKGKGVGYKECEEKRGSRSKGGGTSKRVLNEPLVRGTHKNN